METPPSDGSTDDEGVTVTTKISKDAAQKMVGEGRKTVQNIWRSTGCTSIEFEKLMRGRK